MIVTVTLNAALDITYGVASLVQNTSHRVEHVHGRAGGKGINVARVLRTFGYEVTTTGFLGGGTGTEICEDLATAGVTQQFVEISGESRRTVAVVAQDTGDATVFNEAGPTVTDAEWAAFLDTFDARLERASLVVCAGSLPDGLPHDAYAQMVTRARAAGVATIVDAHGQALIAALAARPAVVKPNIHELEAITGICDPIQGARQLRAMGAECAVISLGPDGMLAMTGNGAWSAVSAASLDGNPTGAGDASVAALAAGHVEGRSWSERLRTAAAWSAAAVLASHAGDVDPAHASRLHAEVTLEEIHDTHPHG